jgi:hypothetical protein
MGGEPSLWTAIKFMAALSAALVLNALRTVVAWVKR